MAFALSCIEQSETLNQCCQVQATMLTLTRSALQIKVFAFAAYTAAKPTNKNHFFWFALLTAMLKMVVVQYGFVQYC